MSSTQGQEIFKMQQVAFPRFIVVSSALLLFAGCGQGISEINTSGYNLGQSHFAASAGPALGYRLVHNFGSGNDGISPVAGLVNLNNKLYGTTEYGGHGGNGTVFRVGSGGGETIVHEFGKRPDGEHPTAGVISVGGTLYGTTSAGGAYNLGTVFKVTIKASGKFAETIIHSFGSGNDGANPTGALTAIKDGSSVELYGTTAAGGSHSGSGTVFEISSSGTYAEAVIHSFGLGSDGATPDGGLIRLNGAFYGPTSTGGGPSNNGAVFRVTKRGRERVLFSFDCTHGKNPVARLTALGGTLYGTTAMGGSANCATNYGSVFSVDSGGSLRTVYNFGASPDGASPMAALALSRGSFYSTTFAGGANGAGTLFRLTPAGRETILHSFGNVTDGAKPLAAPVRMGSWFYGTTSAGGKYGGGTVYAFTR
jgi:uncharacterized repeat protein (TIGR03803 family)